MWTYEHAIETDATRESIWGLWADVPNWGTWNPDVVKAELSGPFAAGAEITMYTADPDPVRLRVAAAVANELFVDEADFDGTVLRTAHRLESGAAGRLRVVYRMEITGPGADELGPQVGPAVTGDWPETMAALVARATGA